MVTRTEIIEAALGYEGVPFRHQGRSRHAGIDCVGLLICVAHDLKISSFDFTRYGREPARGQLEQMLAEHTTPITVAQAQPGDIVLMRFLREPQHVGILTSYGIIHSYQGVGKCVHHRVDGKWAARMVGAFIFPTVEA